MCKQGVDFELSLVLIVLFLQFPLTWHGLQSAAQPLYYKGMLGGRKRRKEEGSFTCQTQHNSKPKVKTEAAKEADASF